MRNTDDTTWIIDPLPLGAPRVWDASDARRSGRVICATSPHADGSLRVLVAWDDGTEAKAREADLRYRRPTPPVPEAPDLP